MAELAARCFVVRGLNPTEKIVIGIATEQYQPGKGFSLDAFYMDKPDWTDEDQGQLEYLQREFGYFAKPLQSRLRGATVNRCVKVD